MPGLFPRLARAIAVLAALLSLLGNAGCHRAEKAPTGAEPAPTAASIQPEAAHKAETPPAEPSRPSQKPAEGSPGTEPPPVTERPAPAIPEGAPQGASVPPPGEMKAPEGEPSAQNGRAEPKPANGAAVPGPAQKPPVVKPLPPGEPVWARGKEELNFKVEFLGVTVGYAKFSFMGKAKVDGKEAYHLNLRAWTSGLLSLIYPGETIDYYIDQKTLTPLRQEFTNRDKDEDDIATFDQDKGSIVYRYKKSGEVRKMVDVVPNVYDPVTVAYYFRAREFGNGGRAQNVYAGRKVWQIHGKVLGTEKLTTGRGQVDTIVVQPVIMRDGKLEEKGDLRMWMTSDERRLPVRLYAKFKKIKVWTLWAELLPDKEGG